MKYFTLSCIFAITSIILGAFSEHALKDVLTHQDLLTLATASKYLFYNSIPILVLVLTQNKWMWPNQLLAMFSISGVLFSGSLIGYIMTKYKWLVYITPLGGILMILSWLLLMIIGIKKINKVMN